MLQEAWKDESGGLCLGGLGSGYLPSTWPCLSFSVPTCRVHVFSVQVALLGADWLSVGTAGLSVPQL